MPLDAITYRVRPGHDEQLADIFSPHNFRRVDSPVVTDPDGRTLGMLLGTSLFVQDDVLVRIIHHDGLPAARIAEHMSVQEGVHEAERALEPYLTEERDTETPEGFRAHFHRSLMTVLEQDGPDDRPAAGTVALRYPLRPGAGAELAAGGAPGGAPSLRLTQEHPSVIRTALLLHGDLLVRAVQYDGHPYDVVGYLTERCWKAGAEDWLGGFLARPEAPAAEDAYLVTVHEQAMRSVAHMSMLGVG